MRAAPQALIDYLAAARANADIKLLFADCFTFSLSSATVFYYTNVDVDVVYNGATFIANSILVDGLKYKCSVGLSVDSQKITISAKQTDSFDLHGPYLQAALGAPFLQALREGILDGASVQRDRVFFSDQLGGTVIGGVTLFKGRVGSIDSLGRTTAQVNVNSELVLLNIDMPRNLWQPTCLHTLYDSGCTLVKSAFSANGNVGVGSTAILIKWTGAASKYQQGSITFLGGPDQAITAAVKSVTPGVSMLLGYPLEVAPAVGDPFTVYQGCDHTPSTCRTKFSNQANFRGFPYVPPPEVSI